MAGEFDLIARYFAPLAGPEGLGLKDDAALLRPPPGMDLVLTADANVAGVHFLANEAPDIAARRLLRTNLSDLAAKGARPLGYLLTLALPASADEAWIAGFAAGLAADQATYGVALYGGDTVATPGPVVASITAIGAVARGRMLRRSGARAGDDLYVTGCIGDGVFGLEAACGRLEALDAAANAYLADRYRLPSPRVAFGMALAEAGGATGAADISDGLVADAGHIAEASGVAIEITAVAVPLSAPVRMLLHSRPEGLAEAITGGDDYELVFTAPKAARPEIEAVAARTGVRGTRIGRVLAGAADVTVLDRDGLPMRFERRGYVHR